MTPEDGYQPLKPAHDWPTPPSSDAWSSFLQVLDERRAEADDVVLRQALDIALRSAALETGALEGLYPSTRGITRTVALQGAAWEASLDEIGADVRGHFDAQLDALELVLDLVTESRPVTQAWIRQLHAVTCRNQKTYRVTTLQGVQEHLLPHGEYKQHSNHVITADGATHFYCPPADVEPEMTRLIDELNSPAFAALGPVAQAAYAHYAFVAIHPFADGNGRVARALTSVYLYRAVGIPLVIFSDQQERYWDALAATDRGNADVLITFIEDRALDTMAMISARLREAALPTADRAAQLLQLFRANGGLTHAELEACGQRLVGELTQMLSQISQTLTMPDLQSSTITYSTERLTVDFGRPYHSLQGGGKHGLSLTCRAPILMKVEMTPIVGLANEAAERFAFIVIDANRPHVAPLLLRTDDLHPGTTHSAEERMRAWLQEGFDRLLQELEAGVRKGLAQQGFTT